MPGNQPSLAMAMGSMLKLGFEGALSDSQITVHDMAHG